MNVERRQAAADPRPGLGAVLGLEDQARRLISGACTIANYGYRLHGFQPICSRER